jgi:hypothetical protein
LWGCYKNHQLIRQGRELPLKLFIPSGFQN